VIAALLALAGVALVQAAPDRGAAFCSVEPASIVSRSPSGLAQVATGSGELDVLFKGRFFDQAGFRAT
jgi:hypothetical protein